METMKREDIIFKQNFGGTGTSVGISYGMLCLKCGEQLVAGCANNYDGLEQERGMLAMSHICGLTDKIYQELSDKSAPK